MKKPVVKIWLVSGVLIAAVVVYLVFFRKSPLQKADEAAYNRLYDYLLANIQPEAVRGWLGDLARDAYKDGGIDPYYLVDGKVTKTGALLAVYVRAYANPSYGYQFSKPHAQVTQGAYDIFDTIKYATPNKI